jgi:hypothetical protein
MGDLVVLSKSPGNIFRPSLPANTYEASTAQYYVTEFTVLSFGFLGWDETGTSATNCPIVSAPDDRWWVWSSRWNENWQGKPKYSEETCPSANLSTTNPTWPDLGSNLGRSGGKPATNRRVYTESSLTKIEQQFYQLLFRWNVIFYHPVVDVRTLCLPPNVLCCDLFCEFFSCGILFCIYALGIQVINNAAHYNLFLYKVRKLNF